MRKLTEPKIVLASHNKGKLREISALLEPFGIDVVSAGELGLTEPDETEDSFAGNARIKAHYAAKESGLPALSDDSGLEIDALDGAPGVYTADWAETGNGRDFGMAMQKAQDKLDAVNAAEPRLGRFCCTLCIAWPDGHDEIFAGTVSGHLVWPPRGERGFGYDPMFIPAGHDETFGEMDPARKQKISHRADAFAKFKAGALD
ncbi:RdgB/HAM1 family non-canonical purine NTP pyrophosphatase [Qingshengfaniella alkalisoli]|uniref:dITP/XTP pyrophosphatase n=1 Tax=Qingshengfaniella alkalisoli TaxID=2599296 RepID=A0A5B8IWF3_9RHOB|nr:RdgB/HAM1 family non-canonical purine NTP pyrophosphatase [Qingshengfaniella alkalisoli]QDY69994.1 RdgB/HAM1 family non-canonical purine NTP pyrophosphatase [Qingshengfaniella alkalisoli]